jgi:hypothetical protein
MLSVRSISTGRILPVEASSILPVYWLQLLTCFTPGDRSTKMRGSNETSKMAARTIFSTSNYSSDGSTDLALECLLLLHSLSSHYTVIMSTGTTFKRSQNICKLLLPCIKDDINITISHHYYFHYKLLLNPHHQPPQHGYHQQLQHGPGQHLQHGDKDARFHQKFRGSSKACSLILVFFTLLDWNLPLSLPPSNLTQVACHTIALSKVKQFHHLPWASQHMCPHCHAQYYQWKSGNLLHPRYHSQRSSLFLMYLRVLLAITPHPSSLMRH